MNTLVLDEAPFIDNLFPFTATRQVIDIRVGILTLREKWERLAPGLLAHARPGNFHDPTLPVLTIPANILPSAELVAAIKASSPDLETLITAAPAIRHPWDIFALNDAALRSDFKLLTEGRLSRPIPASVQAVSPENIFIEEGARITCAILNASTGPIYIGRNAEIMEGSTIRGPFALGEGAVVKMGTRIYGATTIGPCSTVGGEIKNSVLFGCSNKGHDGYLGDSVIGEWCNLGAGTSNSNLKNNAGIVSAWDHASGKFIPAGQKCGLIMGDYSRSAINTSFNTGTVTGPCCNIFGEGLTPKYIPGFSWGQDGATRYTWDKVIRDIANWKKLKNQSLTEAEIQTLKHIFEKL
jgi:UDP-N-acetylglucosamine diphosphorylase/glucosamine-1-phosphate N-acetyltransferase